MPDGRVGGVQRPPAGADRRTGRDRLALRTLTLEKVELLMVGREATEEASGDARRRRQKDWRVPAPRPPPRAAPWLERAPVRV